MDSQQQRYYAIYKAALDRLHKNPNDTEAEFTVNLWEASKNLYRKNTDLKTQLEAATKTATTNYHKIDQLESKVELLQHRTQAAMTGTAQPSFEAYMASLKPQLSNKLATDKDSGTFAGN